MKKFLSIAVASLLAASALVGCGGQGTSSQGGSSSSTPSEDSFKTSSAITVIARDSASGTRAAFHELMGVIQKQDGTTVDNLVVGALEFDGTDKVITAVEGDPYAIGYISLGSVSDRIKAAKVDGVAPSSETVKDGSYPVARPFLLVTNGEENELVQDFLAYIASAEGQEIVTSKNYISVEESPAPYTGSGKSGTIKLAGSTSVEPLMQVLTEGYRKVHPGVTFEIQAPGSRPGITAAMAGTFDIGMSSRELTDEEASALNSHVIAMDGIAVIVNNENPVEGFTSEDLTAIYTGEITTWDEIK